MTVARAVVAWWVRPVPLARVAVLRAVLYLFVVWDVLYLTNDVLGHAYAPDLAQPLLLARLLHLPGPSVPLARTLLVLVVVSSLVAATGRLPRIAGWTAGIAFLLWMLDSQGFSYVSHDHMALVLALLVLPTVGRARFTDAGSSEAAGWAFRVIQVATVLTYFGSAVVKWVRAGSPWAWANGSVFVWAIMRRGSDAIRWTLEVPVLLHVGQWVLLVAEFLAPLALALKGRLLFGLVAFFLVFHAMTFVALGIHFLPTAVCWLAFAPTERLVPWVLDLPGRAGRRVRRTAPATASS